MANYVEREAAIAAIKKDIMGGLNYESILKRIPSEDVQPVKHGKWIPRYDMCDFLCSNCKTPEYSITLFCPFCGAKMDGEDNV